MTLQVRRSFSAVAASGRSIRPALPCPALPCCPDWPVLGTCTQKLKLVEFAPGDVVLRTGETGNCAYWLLAGGDGGPACSLMAGVGGGMT